MDRDVIADALVGLDGFVVVADVSRRPYRPRRRGPGSQLTSLRRGRLSAGERIRLRQPLITFEPTAERSGQFGDLLAIQHPVDVTIGSGEREAETVVKTLGE